MSDTKKLLIKLFSNSKAAGIDVCVLRNYETLPSAVPGSDIDILVAPTSAQQFVVLLLIATSDQGWMLDSRYEKNHRITHFRFYKRCKVSSTVQFIRFDVMTAIGGGASCFFDAPTVLNTAQKNEWFSSPGRQIENAINIFLATYYGVPLKQHYWQSIQSDDQNKLRDTLCLFATKKLVDELLSWTKHPQGQLPPIYFKKRLSRRAFARSPLSYCKEMLRVWRVVVSRVIRPSGQFLVILGPDGVGKSTVIAALAEHLSPVYADVATGHLRPRLLPELSTLLGRGAQNANVESEVENSESEAGFFSSLVRMIYYGIDYIVGYWVRVFPCLIKGQVVLYDRYFYDYFVDHGQKKVTLPFRFLRSICWLFPKPEQVYFLHAEPEQIRLRRADLSKFEIKRQNKEFLALRDIYPEIYVVDAAQSVEKIVGQIVFKSVKE